MTLEESLALLIQARKSKLRISDYFRETADEREFEIDEIKKIFFEGECVSLTKQRENRLRLTFKYNAEKDLNIVIDIISKKQVDLVTVFPQNIERRIR